MNGNAGAPQLGNAVRSILKFNRCVAHIVTNAQMPWQRLRGFAAQEPGEVAESSLCGIAVKVVRKEDDRLIYSFKKAVGLGLNSERHGDT